MEASNIDQESSGSPALCFDLLDGSATDDKAIMTALGQAQWLEVCWFPTQRRKHPAVQFSIQEGSTVCIQDSKDSTEDWNKHIRSALKKIIVEDLGNMDAVELKETIPEEDKDGRGLRDLEALEKQLSVKVVFLEHNKHVLLVGQKVKLQKKTFVIRNMLSHYHWRLTGKDVSR